MAAEVFVDTSAWYPLADQDHPDHPRLAETLRRRIARGVQPVTTNLVVAETHALILRRLHAAAAVRFLAVLDQPPTLVVTSTPELERRAVEDWLRRYEDQEFTLTDAVSFAVMRERRIREALTLDRHFLTAGFVVDRD